jgi:predicted RNA-binding protein with PUA-like domain
MNAGDKAFFYHSNCKEPGIAGIMEIVKEFSEDSKSHLHINSSHHVTHITWAKVVQSDKHHRKRPAPRNALLRSVL